MCVGEPGADPSPTTTGTHLPGGPAQEPLAEPCQHQNRDITIQSWLLCDTTKQEGLW